MTISELKRAANSAPKFVLFTNEFGEDMYIADAMKTPAVVTDNVQEALEYSVGFDNINLKLKYWCWVTGYNLQIKYL